MKYGKELQRRSIAAWRAHNIDYDEIKRFIKKRTSPGNGESISVPGRGDEKIAEFELELSDILTQQHERINLFVKSKVGEIKRRLEHAKRQLRQLSSRRTTAADRRIPIARLERYSRLENDVVKVGDEVRSLARFTSTNRTAFRKLIKKARKWTGSERLCAAFQEDTLLGGESYLQLDYRPLLDDFSETLANIRNLYESRIKDATSARDETTKLDHDATASQKLQAGLKAGSKVDFDTAMATVPLGESGHIAHYFVHPEYVVELQVLLLHYVQPYASRSRHNSLTRSPSNGVSRGSTNDDLAQVQDFHMLVADNLNRFAKVEGAVTIDEREHVPGTIPQRAKYCMRWTSDEDAVLAAWSDTEIRTAPLKRKHADAFFDAEDAQRRDSETSSADPRLVTLREEISQNKHSQPLFKISSARQRFTGIGDSADSVILATLDSNISVSKGSSAMDDGPCSKFPFAVLQMRGEGHAGQALVKTLDESHLVERVRGFSLQYHAFWQAWEPDNTSAPFWIPILARDIRKLPPPAQRRNDSLVPRGSASGSANQASTGTNSLRGLTDETTAVETPRPSSGAAENYLQTPPLKAFRKKRRRKYATGDDQPSGRSEQRYWNEYDNPEDGEGENAYVIYIDPNERSTLDKMFDSIGNFFSPRRPQEPDADAPSSGTPRDDESSSEDEDSTLSPRHRGYGTLNERARSPEAFAREHHRDTAMSLPQVTSLCLAASIAILAITFILAATSKPKYARTVDTAIVFAIVCSLVFAGVGFVALMGQRQPKSWGALGLAAAVLLLDAICSGGLLAWMLG